MPKGSLLNSWRKKIKSATANWLPQVYLENGCHWVDVRMCMCVIVDSCYHFWQFVLFFWLWRCCIKEVDGKTWRKELGACGGSKNAFPGVRNRFQRLNGTWFGSNGVDVCIHLYVLPFHECLFVQPIPDVNNSFDEKMLLQIRLYTAFAVSWNVLLFDHCGSVWECRLLTLTEESLLDLRVIYWSGVRRKINRTAQLCSIV